MNKYVWYKVIHKLKQSKFLYSFMVIQFMVGFLILNIFLTASISLKKEYSQMMRSGLDKEYEITIELANKEVFSLDKFDLFQWGKKEPVLYEYKNPPVNLEDIQYMETLTKGKVNAEVKVFIEYLGGDDDEAKRYALRYNNQVEEIGMSADFMDISANIKTNSVVNPRDYPYDYNKKEEKLLCRLTGDSKPVTVTDSYEVEAVLPWEWYLPFFHYKDLSNMKLTIGFDKEHASSFSDLNNKMKEVKDYLEKSHEDYQYTIGNSFFDYVNRTHTLKESSTVFNFIAIVILLIILVGLVGVFLLFIERRKKELAIGIALGAQKKVLIWEVFLEIFSIAFLGYLLGVMISSVILLQGVSSATVIIKFCLEVSLLLVILPFIISIIAVGPSVYMIKKLEPMGILRNL